MGWAVGMEVGWAVGEEVGWAVGVEVGWAVGVEVTITSTNVDGSCLKVVCLHPLEKFPGDGD